MLFLAANPIFDAYHQSDFFGKSIFILLAFLSVITWLIFIQKILLQKAAKKKSFTFLHHFQKKQHNPLQIETPADMYPFSTLYHTLKEHTIELLKKNRTATRDEEKVYLSHSDIDFIEAHLSTKISAETKQMEKNLFILSTIVSLAPFLGLLGTVWGILLTFAELQTGGAAHANAAVMGGLAMALGTTVLGLVVAIPALIAFNYLKSSISHFATDMDDFSHLLLASVEFQYRKVDVR